MALRSSGTGELVAVAADHGLTDHAALLRRAAWLLARRLWDERTGALRRKTQLSPR
jgi:hypothetical protein